MYEVNVLGTLQVTKALLPASRGRAARGSSSTSARSPAASAYEGGGGYTVAKHGVHVMTETLRLELVDQPVRITLVAPGMVRTDEFSLTRFGGDQERADAVYAGVAEPLVAEDIADAIVLDGDPPGPRQHRPAGRQAARPGRLPQGAPGALRALRRVSGVTTGAKGK